MFCPNIGHPCLPCVYVPCLHEDGCIEGVGVRGCMQCTYPLQWMASQRQVITRTEAKKLMSVSVGVHGPHMDGQCLASCTNGVVPALAFLWSLE